MQATNCVSCEEVLDDGFLNRFPDADYAGRSPVIESKGIERIFKEFRRLRLTDQIIYLRNGSVNLIDGMINMGFSCDGAHYIYHQTFFAKLQTFDTSDQPTNRYCRHRNRSWA